MHALQYLDLLHCRRNVLGLGMQRATHLQKPAARRPIIARREDSDRTPLP